MRWFGILAVLLLAGCGATDSSAQDPKTIVLDSYQKFEEQGVTETLTNQEGVWTLVFDPTRPDYQAGWFDESGKGELIFETVLLLGICCLPDAQR